MCGIAGIIGWPESRALELMARALQHRGPDDHGIWMDCEAGIGLAHTRLAIQDLSLAGHQPMLSSSQGMVMVFNGEIYNHLELRAKLSREVGEVLCWHGHSDTETLLAGFEIWGVEKMVNHCVGMFAFALWNRREHTLTLGRDRLGEKPLYYGRNSGAFFFASDLRALRAHPAFSPTINDEALADYLRYGYVPAPHSIYQGIHKLVPGSTVTISSRSQELPLPKKYWSLAEVAESGRLSPFIGSEEEARDRLEELLTVAVKGQKLSDVPLGSFLSGGIDSSLVTAILQSQSSRPVHTFTIGFEEASHNEADQAREVARLLGTSHNELTLTAANVCDFIPSLPSVHSEPFCDPSQLPTFLLSRFARQSVTVSLSGDGGDELFCGYQRYHTFAQVAKVPRTMRAALAALLAFPSTQNWDRAARFLGPQAGDKAHKLARILGSETIDSMYLSFLAIWPPEENISKLTPSSDFLETLKHL